MIGVISDVHGNYEALKEVLSYFDTHNITELYCLGDIVGYYSQVNECCDELRSRQVVCLMGNHDWYMAADSFCPRSQSVNDCLHYQRAIITPKNKEWLMQSHIYYSNDKFSMVHGGWTNPIDEYVNPSKEYFDRLGEKMYFSGHTHIQGLYEYKKNLYCNPGSVGQPRDGDPRAAFAVVDQSNIFLQRVPYNINKVCDLMEKNGFSAYYYDCLKNGAKNLGYSNITPMKSD